MSVCNSAYNFFSEWPDPESGILWIQSKLIIDGMLTDSDLLTVLLNI